MDEEIKAVIFDMGGVILRSEDPLPRKSIAEKYTLTPESIYQLVFSTESAKLATIGKITEREHWKAIGKKLGIDGVELINFEEQFWSGDQLDAELISFIGNLKPKFHTGLLSNAWSGARKYLTEIKPCMHVFEFSLFSFEVGLAKPDPDIYLTLLNRMGVTPNQAIFVDDVLENIAAANALGIHGIQFINSEQAQRDVSNLLLS
jgi:glucose-1-phosphatase